VVPEPERDENAPSDDAAGDFDAEGAQPAAAEPAPPTPPGPDLEALAAQARQIIDDANHSAEKLMADARERATALGAQTAREAAAAADEARRQAHDEGYLAGAKAAQDETAAQLSTLRELVEATRSARHALLTTAEPELVRLAVTIAERVLHQQIALDPGVVVEMAKAAIARIVDREKITIRVNPADVAAMREQRDALLALGDVKTMRVIEDQRVERGGVIIETDAGNIDAKISTQVAEARKILHIVDDLEVRPVALDAGHDLALTASKAS
jgi:flagellar assembly protein FliH